MNGLGTLLQFIMLFITKDVCVCVCFFFNAVVQVSTWDGSNLSIISAFVPFYYSGSFICFVKMLDDLHIRLLKKLGWRDISRSVSDELVQQSCMDIKQVCLIIKVLNITYRDYSEWGFFISDSRCRRKFQGCKPMLSIHMKNNIKKSKFYSLEVV